ncbi:MAG: molybdenum ABC transporter ATP-binding protein [Gammaproteobacteria bacterium]|nr:molybdenum ABC transporter ATP-binding protein [Gammaproteobacteria bacterium]
MIEVDIQKRQCDFNLDVNVEIPLGVSTAVIGANGSGKTTFLYCLAGLLRPSGRIRFDDTDWINEKTFLQPYAREIGFVFQDARLFSHLTVSKNLDYAESRSSHRPTQISRKKVIQTLELENLLQRSPADISGGESQRVAIARAILCQPRLLLLDEPLAAIDDKNRKILLPFLKQLTVEHAMTIVFVSHAVDEVTALADYALLLDQGKRIAFGASHEVLQTRALRALTSYRNSGAVLYAKFTGWDEKYKISHFSIEGRTLSIPLFLQSKKGADSLLFVQARDVSIALQPCRDISIRNELPGTILTIEQGQDDAFVDIKIAIGNQYIFSRITRAASDALKLAPGVRIYALIKSASFG